MASTPKMEYQIFLCIFQKNSAMATLGLKKLGKFLLKGREKGLPCWLWLSQFGNTKLRQPAGQAFFPGIMKSIQIPPTSLSDPLISNVPGLLSSQDSKVTDFSFDQSDKSSLVIVNVFPPYEAESTTLSIVKEHVTVVQDAVINKMVLT